MPNWPFGVTCSRSAVGRRTHVFRDRHVLVSRHTSSVSRTFALSPARDDVLARTNREECLMNSKSKLALTLVVGAAVGAAAMQGLHAQAKPKAYHHRARSDRCGGTCRVCAGRSGCDQGCWRAKPRSCHDQGCGVHRRGTKARRYLGVGKHGISAGLAQFSSLEGAFAAAGQGTKTDTIIRNRRCGELVFQASIVATRIDSVDRPDPTGGDLSFVPLVIRTARPDYLQ